MIRLRLSLALAIVSTMLLAPSIAGQGPATEALFGLDSPRQVRLRAIGSTSQAR
jgi:hypothetical protein